MHVVTVLSTAYPGHSTGSVTRRVANQSVSIPRPLAIGKYMGRVDLLDQLMSYHNILGKNVRYWKTLFYHLIDAAVLNSHILHSYVSVYAGMKLVTENNFRDTLVLQIIEKYGQEKRQHVTPGRPPASSC